MRYFKLLLASKLTHQLVIFILATGILFMSFQSNYFQAASQSWFDEHQFDSEALVIGRLVFSRATSPLEEAGRLGKLAGLSGDENTNQTLLFEKHIDYKGTFSVYNSQLGGQGVFYSYVQIVLDKFSVPAAKQISYLHGVSSFLLASILGLFIVFVAIEFGFLPAAMVALAVIYGQWLVVFGDNLYWFTWSMYAPMVVVFGYLLYGSRRQQPAKLTVIAPVLFVLVGIRCSAGYEYISTILLAMITPIIYFSVKDGWAYSRLFRFILGVGLAAIAAFLCVNMLHVLQISVAENKPFMESFMERLSHAHSRTYVEENAFGGGTWRDATTASVWEVVHRYWTGDAYKFSNFSPLNIVINYFDVVYLFVITALMARVTCFKLTLSASADAEAKCSQYMGLTLAGAVAFVAPLSWYVLAKVHSYVHGHMNHLLWHIPFTLWTAVFSGLILKEKLIDAKNYIFASTILKVSIVSSLVFATAYLSFAPHFRYKAIENAIQTKSLVHYSPKIGLDLYVLDNNTLVYKYQNCKQFDPTKRFFLHLYLHDQSGYSNRDFNWFNKQLARPIWPSSFRDSCMAVISLPFEKITSINTGQFESFRFWENNFNIPLLKEGKVTSHVFSDKQWNNGISTGSEAGLFVQNTPKARYTLKTGGYLKLPFSGVRRIQRLEYYPKYINIWLEGGVLSPDKDGAPNAILYNEEGFSNE